MGYNAVLDAPACWLALELRDRFPHAKVILTTRNSSTTWFESFKENLDIAAQMRHLPYRLSRQNRLHIEMDNIAWGRRGCLDPATGRATEAQRETCIASHERHNAAVRAAVPAGLLLEYRMGEGWGPLCEFLNASQSDRPFPHTWTR